VTTDGTISPPFQLASHSFRLWPILDSTAVLLGSNLQDAVGFFNGWKDSNRQWQQLV
jgi:hypothetical protein